MEDDLEALESLEDNSAKFPPQLLEDLADAAARAKYLVAPAARASAAEYSSLLARMFCNAFALSATRDPMRRTRQPKCEIGSGLFASVVRRAALATLFGVVHISFTSAFAFLAVPVFLLPPRCSNSFHECSIAYSCSCRQALINHSCQPNAEVQLTDTGHLRVVTIVAVAVRAFAWLRLLMP